MSIFLLTNLDKKYATNMKIETIIIVLISVTLSSKLLPIHPQNTTIKIFPNKSAYINFLFCILVIPAAILIKNAGVNGNAIKINGNKISDVDYVISDNDFIDKDKVSELMLKYNLALDLLKTQLSMIIKEYEFKWNSG